MSIIKIDLFSTKLRTFSISISQIFIYLCLSLLLISCGGGRGGYGYRGISTPRDYTPISSQTERITVSPKAPWEVWPERNFPSENLKKAKRFTEEGALEKAEAEYSKALSSARSSEEAEAALIGICSSLLKRGKSSEALSKISKYASLNNKQADQLDSVFSLITAYAYINKNDTNQALAWFAQTFKTGRGTGSVAEEARRASMQLVRTLDSAELSTLSDKWKQDTFVSSLVQGEKSRRLQGGSRLRIETFKKWFDVKTYYVPLRGEVQNEAKLNTVQDLNQSELIIDRGSMDKASRLSGDSEIIPHASSSYTFGALLPLSGPYKSHAEFVKEGIELAINLHAPGSKLFTQDSTSSLNIKFQDLVRMNSVQALFGPLLVQDSEQIAYECEKYRVPCISFAKKKGIPELSQAMFRLGATSENQINVLLQYAEWKFASRSVVLFYPENSIGIEFAQSAEAIKMMEGKDSLQLISYNPRSLESVHQAVESAKNYYPDTLIIADTIVSAEPLLRHLKDPSLSGDLARAQLMGTSLFTDQRDLQRLSSLLEGARVVSLFHYSSNRESVKSFVSEYRTMFKKNPDLLAAQSYDAATYVIQAYNTTSQRTLLKGNEIDSIKSMPSIEGVTGKLTVLENGELYRNLPVLLVTGGSLLEE